MRFVKTQKSIDGLVTIKGKSYTNKHGRRTHHARKSETPINFVGVDGEGMTVDGEHRYVLFGVGENQIADPGGLTWKRVFDHAYGLYRPGTAYVGFFLGYDFTQILKTMPENRAHMLLTSEGRALRKHRIPGKAPHPVDCDGWQFDMLGSKRLRIRPKGCDCEFSTCKCKHAPWLYVCDVGPFFQTSFLKVIDPRGWTPGTAVVTDQEYDIIREGKERRSTGVLDEEMKVYNRLENVVLSRVMRTLDEGFHGIGIHLPASKWFGPGQAAQAWLKNVGAPTREEITEKVPAWFLEAARMSYFGGWFEIMMHGIVPGGSHEYDINSAYPSIIAGLPCLLHGAWSHGDGMPMVDKRELCLVYARLLSPCMPNQSKTQHIGAMLHRDGHGRILRPMATEGWYWFHELKAAEKAGLIKRLDNRGKQQILKWVKYSPCDCPPPMRDIRGLYLKRLEVGKTSPLGKAAKLTYNSDYGKFAQSVGDPIFGNPVYASLITAGCRTIILEAIATHPKGKADVAMVATDAVYFLSPHPGLTISENLGEWDHKLRSNLTLFKPGVYWDDDTRARIARGDNPNFKARGFNAADFVASLDRVDLEFAGWEHGGPPYKWPEVSFPAAFSMVTALQALRRGAWDTAGIVEEGKVITQNADPSDKRYGLRKETYDGRTIFRSKPHYGARLMAGESAFVLEWAVSTPYEKRFGMDDPWSDEYRQVHGESTEGNLSEILAWILKGD